MKKRFILETYKDLMMRNNWSLITEVLKKKMSEKNKKNDILNKK